MMPKSEGSDFAALGGDTSIGDVMEVGMEGMMMEARAKDMSFTSDHGLHVRAFSPSILTAILD